MLNATVVLARPLTKADGDIRFRSLIKRFTAADAAFTLMPERHQLHD
jgi:hypothetical protein